MRDPHQNKWLLSWKALVAQGDPLLVHDSLVARYSEPQRAYHNLDHIHDCLDEWENVRKLAMDPNAIEMAIWFHDAVYDPKAKDNEEQSAEMAKTVIQSAELSPAFSGKVADLILATKHNAPPKDGDAALLIDIDLSILGQPMDKFSRYENAIRKEYDWVAADAFAKGRSAILKSFLERPAIYYTDFFREKYEAAARRNLAFSVAQLQH